MCSQCKSASLQQRRVRIGVFGAGTDSGSPSFSASLSPNATGICLHFEPTAKMGEVDAAIVSVMQAIRQAAGSRVLNIDVDR